MDHSPPSDLPKPALRRTLLAMRAALPEAQQIGAGQALLQHLNRLIDAGMPRCVGGYWPIRGEIDPRPLMRAISALGAALALPRTDGDAMTFHRWKDSEDLVKGAFGIFQPAADAPLMQPDLLLVPLVGFDAGGRRLGYGGGYYDRVLATYRPAMVVGLAHASQEISRLPREIHDQPLDFIATDRAWVDCRSFIES